MSTMFIGGRRVQLRVVFFVVTVFVLILIFTASSSKLQNSLNTFKDGYKYGSSSSTPSSPNAHQNPPTSSSSSQHQDEVSKPASGNHKMATDPCVAQDLPDGGVTVRKVQGTRVLVTGGAGFIGSNLVDTLLELGYKVRVFDNLYTGFIRNVPLHDDRVEFMFGDIMDPAMLEKAVDGVDYVYHLAAMSKVVPSLKNPEMARFCVEANALGTWNVLNAVRNQGKIKKVIYAASSTYYGNNPPPHNEDMAPDFLTPYAASKYEGELQMQMFDRLFSVPTISTRFFMVYGPRQPSTGAYAIVTGVFAKQAADGKQLTIEGDGSHYRDFIHVKDIVNGLILSQQHPDLHGNVVNLGTGTAFTVQDVADLVSKDQKHVDARKNDLEGTLADTCRMKSLLGYKASMDFKQEMSYMVDQTMKGNVFMQQWLKPAHALSAPHLLAPGTPVFNWPKKQNDLDALLTALQNIKVDTGSANDRHHISVIPFSIGSNNASVITDLMLNTVFSLVRFGEVSSYIVTAMDKTALETCISLNLPCYDAESTSSPEILHNLLKQGYSVHYAELGNSYTSPVNTFFESLSEADIYQAAPYGDVFIHSNQKTIEATQSWSSQSTSNIPGNMLFIPSTWPETLGLKKTSYTVETLCNGKIDGKTATSSSSQSSSTESSPSMSSEKAQALADNKNPAKSYEKEIEGKSTEKSARSESSASFCDKSRFYVPAGCGTENEAGIGKNAAEVKAALQKTALWHLTECADKEHCDIQQSVPFRWLEKTPDLKERGGLC